MYLRHETQKLRINSTVAKNIFIFQKAVTVFTSSC